MDHKPAGSGEAVLVRTALTYEGRQGLTYGEGVFAENTGARGLCLHAPRTPLGGRAKADLDASRRNGETELHRGRLCSFMGRASSGGRGRWRL